MMQHLFTHFTRYSLRTSFAVFFLAFMVGTGVVLKSNEQYVTLHQSDALIAIQNKAAALENQITHNTSANRTLATLIQEFGGHTYWFDDVAKTLLESDPNIDSVSLSPGGIVTKIYPRVGNEVLIGFNQLEDKAQRDDAIHAKLDKKLTLAGPIDLLQGGTGFVARFPARLEDRWGNNAFWGFTNVVIKLDKLMAAIDLASLERQGYFYQLERLRDGAQLDDIPIIDNLGDQILISPVSVRIELPNTKWRLSVAPQAGWLPAGKQVMSYLVVFLVALILARLTWLAIRLRASREELRGLVSERTSQRDVSQRRHLSTLEALPDYLLELDCSGVIKRMHVPQDETSDLVHFRLHDSITAAMSDDSARTIHRALEKVRTLGSVRGLVVDLHHGDQKRWFELSIVATEPTGDDACVVVLARDVTSRHQSDEALRISATAFETQDGIIITDKYHQIIRVNSAFERISGYSQDEVIGKTPKIFRSGRHDDNFYRVLAAQLVKNGAWHGEIWNRRKSGDIYPELLSISSVRNQANELTHYVATFRDVSDEKANQRRIQQLHYYDSLTQLPNKNLLLEEMEHLIDDLNLGLRRSAALFIDVDNFKVINDVHGHGTGDELLKQVASRLMEAVRAKDLVARFGADEFVVILEDSDASMSPERIAYRARHVSNRILDVMAEPFVIEDIECHVTVSVGICMFGKEVTTALDILKQAELAMYEAKSGGRNQSCFYLPKMQERIMQRVEMDSDIRRALVNQEFILHYQPQWNREREIVGVEALVRWHHPEKGMVPPGLFIPFAEESRLILPIGDWVLNHACQTKASWLKNGLFPKVVMAINVSALQFEQEDFVAKVQTALAKANVPPEEIQLELTESMLVHDQADVIEKMRALKQLGVLISLDDFGTGYSSLSYLQDLPIDQLKIDQSFVAHINDGERDASIAASIIGLGQNLGMEVIAEGVEDDTQFDWLKQQGCDLFQGYGLSRPLDEKNLIDSFAQRV